LDARQRRSSLLADTLCPMRDLAMDTGSGQA
jgi:hypothetical protein